MDHPTQTEFLFLASGGIPLDQPTSTKLQDFWVTLFPNPSICSELWVIFYTEALNKKLK
jgi:hypothetical protein